MERGADATKDKGRAPSGLLFLNNYTRTGIGDFGLNLIETLKGQGVSVQVEETGLSWKGFFPQLRKARSWDGPFIANLGLTSWGTSGVRNLLGFLSLGRSARRRRTVVVLHNLIEIIEPKDAGYRVGWVKTVGAHRAVRFLRAANLVVLSPRMQTLLKEKYGMDALCLVSPCKVLPVRPSPPRSRPLVASLGYLAPYKGVDIFLSVAEAMGEKAEFVLIGGAHRVLSQDPKVATWFQGVRARAEKAGVRLTGYLEETQMNETLQGCSLALLPYTSTSGASASFSTLAAAGIPVIASALPEFELVHEKGAGVVLVPPRPEEFLAAVRRLLADPQELSRLASLQRAFAQKYSWGAFAQQLLDATGPGPSSEDKER